MGTDISTWAVDKDGNNITHLGNWDTDDCWTVIGPFKWRSYFIFGWLAGVRNYSELMPIAANRCIECAPKWLYSDDEDYWDWSYGQSWVDVDELLSIDYDQIIEDRRVTMEISPGLFYGGMTCEEGNGKKMKLRDGLGEMFFDHLSELQKIGANRVYFCFNG